MPQVSGLSESSLYVADLGRSQRFYESLFCFPPLLRDARMCALNVANRQVLLLFLKGASSQGSSVPGGTIPSHDADGRAHLAFSIAPADLQAWRERLAAESIAVESTVHAPRGGTSLYFRDPDGHLIELATPGLWPVPGL